MREQSGGFVDGDDVFVFDENAEGDRFGCGRRFFGGEDFHRDSVARLQTDAFKRCFVVEEDVAFGDQAADAREADFGESPRDEFVEALTVCAGFKFKTQTIGVKHYVSPGIRSARPPRGCRIPSARPSTDAACRTRGAPDRWPRAAQSRRGSPANHASVSTRRSATRASRWSSARARSIHRETPCRAPSRRAGWRSITRR